MTSTTSSQLIPPGSWDCHFHIIDPLTFPYKPDRTYTPEPALLESFMSQTQASNFLLVQCSVENGLSGIRHHLRRAKQEFPAAVFLAEINIAPDADPTDAELGELHGLGVRAVRLHGIIGVSSEGDTISFLKSEFTRLAAISERKDWCIASMCTLETWLALLPWLATNPNLSNTKIIIEHNGRADPNRPIDQYPEFENFLDLVAANVDRFFVKLCGINRLEVAADPPGRMKAIPAATLAIAQRVPENVMWGSDWPHVFYKTNDPFTVTAGKKVDLDNELALLQKALPGNIWQKLMVDNPTRLFAS